MCGGAIVVNVIAWQCQNEWIIFQVRHDTQQVDRTSILEKRIQQLLYNCNLWIDDVNITRGGGISETEVKQRITHFAKSEKKRRFIFKRPRLEQYTVYQQF